MNIDWYLTEAKSELQMALAEATHDLIISVVPNAIVQRKWKIPVFHYLKDLCYMNYMNEDQLYIGFVNGDLMVPHQLLRREKTKYTGKYYISEESDIWADVFTQFLIEAIDIQENRYKK